MAYSAYVETPVGPYGSISAFGVGWCGALAATSVAARHPDRAARMAARTIMAVLRATGWVPC